MKRLLQNKVVIGLFFVGVFIWLGCIYFSHNQISSKEYYDNDDIERSYNDEFKYFDLPVELQKDHIKKCYSYSPVDQTNKEQVLFWETFHGDLSEIYEDEFFYRISYQNKKNIQCFRRGFPSNVKRNKRVRIISNHFNRVDFLKLQYNSIKRYVLDKDYEYIVLNTALDDWKKITEKMKSEYLDFQGYGTPLREQIYQFCKENNIRHEFVSHENVAGYVSNKYEIPNMRCENSLQYLIDKYIIEDNYDGYVVILDSDMFFYEEINIKKLFKLTGSTIISSFKYEFDKKTKKRYDYVSTGAIFMDIERMPNLNEFSVKQGNFHGNSIYCDVGCETYYYLRKYPKVKKKWYRIFYSSISNEEEINAVFENNEKLEKFFLEELKLVGDGEELLSEVWEDINIIHYRRGGNWDLKKLKEQKIRSEHYLDFWMKYMKK